MKVLKKTHLKVDGELKALDQVLYHFNQINEPWIPKEDWLQCRLALAEGFTNAVRHAHKELSKQIPIEIELALGQKGLEIRIWDYGPPFDLDAFVANLCQKKVSLEEGGRGVEILQKIADQLSYIRTDDHRNCLLIVKQFAI
ncbi:MAG: ATP-binding protein [Cyanophyceae cyanobacterium]